MIDLAGETVVVTGGAGFIGGHLTERLLQSGCRRVVVVDSLFIGREANLQAARTLGDVVLVRDDASDPTLMGRLIADHGPAVVFNLATKALLYSFVNPPGAFRVNTDLALTLAELLRGGAFRRLVHVSTSEVYGSALEVPMAEIHPLNPETTYAAGKAAADLALQSYVRMFGLDVVIGRPFNNYGPRQNDGELAGVVPLTIRRLQEGRSPVVEGDGEQTRDFIFVEDTARALTALASVDAPAGTVVNLASGIELPIGRLVAAIAEQMGYDGPVEFRPNRTADVRRHVADTRRATELLGPVATTGLAEGLARTIDWYRSS